MIVKNLIRIIYLVFTIFGVVACSYLLPVATSSLPLNENDFSAVAMCTEHSIKALSSSKLNWIKRITKIDEEIGIIKTGDFDKENKIGFRVRVAIRNKEINIAVKGYGLYFNDLGVSQAINDFRVHLNECLR